MQDALFAGLDPLDMAGLSRTVGEMGLNVERFRRCMDGEATARVRADIDEAHQLGITGTPTFLFGTIEADGRLTVRRRESGAIPTEAFVAIIDRLQELVAPIPPL